jgi:predicted amidohydrolase YtcJ
MALRVVFVNGRVFQGSGRPVADSFAVEGGRFVAVGAVTPGSGDVIQDLGGRLVIPGLVDAHCHPLDLAWAAAGVALTPPAVQSVRDIQEAVADRRSRQGPGAWIVGWGYDEGKLAEGRGPTRDDLDVAAPDAPVLLMRACGHVAAVNSLVLKQLGFGHQTPDPPGGRIDRDDAGRPTGVLREHAKTLAWSLIPPRTAEDNARLLSEIEPLLLAHGLTALTELTAAYRPDNPEQDAARVFRAASGAGFRLPVAVFYVWDEVRRVSGRPRPPRDLFDQQVRLGGLKVFADGSVSGRTAWVDQAYRESDDLGLALTTPEDLRDAANTAAAWGVQLAVHAMGEQAIRMVVDTLAARDPWLPDRPSVRIEHGSFPPPDIVEAAARAGIAFVTQPIFLYAEVESYVRNLGPERTARAYPLRSLTDAGVAVALSSDAPSTAWADPANPWLGLYTAVTRRSHDGREWGSSERIDPATALDLYSKEAAELTGLPGGSIRPGEPADFVVLDRDVLQEPPEAMAGVRPTATFLGGQLVWGRLEGAQGER